MNDKQKFDSFLLKLIHEKRKIFPSRDDIGKKEERIYSIRVGKEEGSRAISWNRNPIPFLRVFSGDGIRIIAEVKKASPSSGKIKDVDESEQAVLYARAGACAISVLTEKKFFGGDISHLVNVVSALVKNGFEVPVLRKDFLIFATEVIESYEAGASSFLLISEALEKSELVELVSLGRKFGMEPLVECFSEEGMEKILSADDEMKSKGMEGIKVIGINSRNLHTLDVSLDRAKSIFLKFKDFLSDKVVVAESGIKTKEDIKGFVDIGVRNFLIGETLMRAPDPEQKIKEFMKIS